MHESIGVVEGYEILRYGISALMKPLSYVNDKILNAYLSTLKVPIRVKILSSDIFMNKLQPSDFELEKSLFQNYPRLMDEFDKVLLPLNLDNSHWVLMVIDLLLNQIRYQDSIRNSPFKMPALVSAIAAKIEKLKNLQLQVVSIYGGQKSGSNDCAPCVAMFVEEEISGCTIVTRDDIDMSIYRSKMFKAIMNHIDSVPQFDGVKDRAIISFDNVKMVGHGNCSIIVGTMELQISLTAGTEEQPVIICFEIAYANILNCIALPCVHKSQRKYFIISLKSFESSINTDRMAFYFDANPPAPDEIFILNVSNDEIAHFNLESSKLFSSGTKKIQCNDPLIALAFCIKKFSKTVDLHCPFQNKNVDRFKKFICELDEKICSSYMLEFNALFLTDSRFVILNYRNIKHITFDDSEGCYILF